MLTSTATTLFIEKLLMCFDIIEINKDRSDAVYSVILLLLYSCDTRAGDTRDGVPELMSKDAREEAARGECWELHIMHIFRRLESVKQSLPQ